MRTDISNPFESRGSWGECSRATEAGLAALIAGRVKVFL
jgi:hypothetical protein